MLRPVDQQDTRFLRDMLRHAYHWRLGDPDLPVYRYVKNWGRRGDAGVIASAGPNAYAAAWYRLFPASAPGFGFVDEETPELTIAVVPSKRGHGTGAELRGADGGGVAAGAASEDGDVNFHAHLPLVFERRVIRGRRPSSRFCPRAGPRGSRVSRRSRSDPARR